MERIRRAGGGDEVRREVEREREEEMRWKCCRVSRTRREADTDQEGGQGSGVKVWEVQPQPPRRAVAR